MPARETSAHTRPDDNRRDSARWLGVLALLGIGAFALVALTLQFVRSDLDWQRVPLSFYLLGPYSSGLVVAYFVLSAAEAALGLGFYLGLDRAARSAAPLTLFVAAAVALDVTAVATTDVSAHPPSLHGLIHNLAAMAAFLFATAAMLLQAWRLRLDARWRGDFPLASGYAGVCFTALWINTLWRDWPRGLSQKILIVLILGWLAWAAWRLYSRRLPSSGSVTH